MTVDLAKKAVKLNDARLESLKEFTKLQIVAAWEFSRDRHRYYRILLKNGTWRTIKDDEFKSYEVLTFFH